ncbi:restriction endonuclease subunit S [Gluconobacter vitians]|uniref:restriction endonuclease subunit S n=1 Tax=Gluconobacter vitians TaxID=2728102 RepID=UPI001885252B|nr:restriction endonuclease subunit S [Gluconobacter vitians]
MTAWKKVTISDVADEVTVGHVGPMASEYVDKGIPFLRSLNIEPFNIKCDGVKFITPSFHKRLQKSSLRPGDVVIVRTGKPGTCAVIPDWLLEANCSDVVIVRCNERVRPRFLCYVVNSVAGHHISSHIVGAVQQHFNVGSARTLDFLLPSIEGQDAILAILGALDDKIDLNRRTNETLEAMARALFRDWFVDFGPTRAKMVGQTPYLAPEIWELFPDRLDDEGKPEGWHYRTLGTLCERMIGGLWGEEEKTPKSSSEFICLRGVDLQHLKETGMCPHAPKRWGNINAIQKRLIQPNEFLIASSGAGPCGRSLWLGKYTQNIAISTPVIFSNFVKKFTTSEESIACYIEFIISNMHRSGEIQSFINGTSVPNLDDDALLKTHTILDPGIEIIRKFFEFIVSVLDTKMSKESRSLAQLRDLLLPKLMSGEIRIRDAEKMVEDAL